MPDLLVIGAGLAGLTAAYIAAKAGLRVKVIAKGLGAVHWGAGTIDVLGYHLNGNPSPIQRPLEAFQSLTETHPQHPYVLLGADRVAEALEIFRALTGEIGLPYSGAAIPGENLLLPSPAGAARPTFLAPQAQLAGDLQRADPLLIVGLRGMRDFFPTLIAANLRKLGHRARAAFLPLSLITDRRDSTPVQLAAELEQPARRARLAAELKRVAQPGERIGLPAILGVSRHLAALADLQAGAGAPIFEIPTLPPSVPGLRLHTALCQRLAELGVRVEVGMQAIGCRMEQGRVLWVETETSARPLRHRATYFLLATGGILGGGFDSDHTGRVWEVVFDLPLAVPQKRSRWFRSRFLDPAGHPVFQGGVPVNRQLQPVHPDGSPVYENLWAAGGLLAHTDPIQERSLEGLAIATGVVAAQHILERHTGTP